MIIVLIEDEMLAMEELRHLMKPYEEDHDVVGFDNGEDAIAYTRHSVPDIVISDIRMPGMNGLQVIQEILSVHPRTQIILLSGYNDFEYARTAIKLGAKEYLLKPVTAAELDTAMNRALNAARMEEIKSQNELQWKLSRTFRGITSPEDRENRQVLGGSWLMIAVLLENWYSPFTWSQSAASIGAFVEWLRKELHPEANCFDMDGHLRIALLPIREMERNDILRRMANRIHMFLHQSAGVVHTVYELKKESVTVEETYQQCLQRLELQIRLGEATFMYVSHGSSTQLFWDSARRIEQHIRNGEYGKLHLELQRMLDGLRRDGNTIIQTSVMLSDFLYALKYKMTDSHSDGDVISEGSIYDYLKTCRTNDALLDWLRDRLAGFMPGIDHGTLQPKQIIPAILDYVHQHYGESVHLQDFATRYHVSTGYLSKLFKAETGSNFLDYIIRIRMNKAIELLDIGYTRVSEISRLVGYEDTKFFSQTFKRFKGVTPQEYKRQEK